jgi:hypothetical protein
MRRSTGRHGGAAAAVAGGPGRTRGRIGDWVAARGRDLVGWVVERRMVLLVGLLAALPVVVAAIRALAWHWFPVSSDQATIAARAVDVLSDQSPLVGQYSLQSLLTGHATYSPGPLLYWLLAIPARVGPSAMVVTMAAVNIASVMGTVALARRRGGNGLMFATAILVAIMCHSLGTERLHDIWNPYVALLPLLMLIFVCWSIACGEHRLLPLAALVASFVAQAQVAFAFPAAGLLLVAICGAVISRRRGQIQSSALRRSVAAAVLVALVCWSAPLYDQAIHRPGNFVAIVQAGTVRHTAVGAATAWRAVVRTVGLPPWWLRDPPSSPERLSDLSSVSALAAISAGLVVASLIAIAVVGARRRRIDVVAVGAIGLVLLAAVAVAAGSTPTRHGLLLTLGYTLWWASPIGMWVYLSLGWAATTLVLSRRPPIEWLQDLRSRLKEIPPARATIAAFSVLVAAAVYTAATQAQDELRPLYAPARAVADRVTDALPSGGRVSVDGSPSFIGQDLQAGLIYSLRRAGWNVAASQFLAIGLGRSYARRPPYDASVEIRDNENARPGEHVLARFTVTPSGGAPRRIVVALVGPGSR